MSRCTFGLFEFDFRTTELRRGGQVVKLPPQPARVLALLLSRPGEVVLREELRAHLWGNDTFVDFERGLNFCILQVRSALGDSSDNPRFVQTVPRKGYRFIAPVAVERSVPEENSLAALRLAGVQGRSVRAEPSVAASPPQSAKRWWIAVAAALVILTPIAWVVMTALAGHAPLRDPERMRIAVLPFANLTGDAANDYLADGLTDELISQLGQASPDRLAVIARTSVMTYRNTPKTVAEIGRDLNVGYVVESSLRRDLGGLRIASSLVLVTEETPVGVWSEVLTTHEQATSEPQTGAAIRIARLIALDMLPEAKATDLPTAAVHSDAWDAYLQGRAHMNRGTPDDVRRAVASFESSVAREPAFAAGWAKLAEAHHLLVMMGASSPAEAYSAAAPAAARALSQGPALADSHLAQGLVQLWHEWRPADAAKSFERALSLNGSHAAAHHDYAWSLVALGRDDEAISHITTSRDLDPLSVRANTDIGWLYLRLRRPADAIRACQHTLAIQSSSLEAQACLERAYAQHGQYEAALRAARASMPANADLVVPADATRPEDALRLVWRWRLERLQEASRQRWISPYTLATHQAMLGVTEGALDNLEAAFTQRIGAMVFLDRDPGMDTLRTSPRFSALTQRIAESQR